jgi:hypothetical protein
MSAGQLIRVDHWRCGEPSAYTFVLAPPDWDFEQIIEALSRARESYLEALEVARSDEPEPPWPPSNLDSILENRSDQTIAQVKAEIEQMRAIRSEWSERQYRTRRQFESFLRDEGFLSLFDENAEIESFEIDWGHRHGTAIDYSETKTDTLPIPAKLADSDLEEEGW